MLPFFCISLAVSAYTLHNNNNQQEAGILETEKVTEKNVGRKREGQAVFPA